MAKAGRPKGIRKTGGRMKGTPNKATAAKAAAIAETGLTPLDYMLQVMRDPLAEPARRLDAAKAAAPFVHPRLNSIEHSGPNGGVIPIAAVEWHVVRPKPPEAGASRR